MLKTMVSPSGETLYLCAGSICKSSDPQGVGKFKPLSSFSSVRAFRCRCCEREWGRIRRSNKKKPKVRKPTIAQVKPLL